MDAVEQLLDAARNGDSKAVRELLLNPKDIPNFDSTLGQALCEAAWRGHRETVELLLDHGADVNYSGSPLRSAAVEAVKLLLDRGAKFYCDDGNAVVSAAGAGHLDVTKLLLDRGANVNTRGLYRTTALITAASKRNLGLVKLLLDHGADVNARNYLDQTAIKDAAYVGDLEVVKLLLNHGAKIDAWGDKPGYTALSEAIRADQPETVELLLDHGADVNAQCDKFESALVRAVYANHIESVRILLDHGANINAHGGGCNNALQMAVTNIREFDPANVYAMVDLLLTRGADVTIQPIAEDRRSLLHHAIEKTNGAVVRRLWDAGAGIHQDTQDASGLIPLHTAVNEKDAEIVEFLLERGASPNSTDIFEESPLKSAILARSSRIVDLLLPTARVGLSSISASDWRSHFDQTRQSTLKIRSEGQIRPVTIENHSINVFAAVISGHSDMASNETLDFDYFDKVI